MNKTKLAEDPPSNFAHLKEVKSLHRLKIAKLSKAIIITLQAVNS